LALFAHGVHVHFDEHYVPRLHDTEELVEVALGLARDLLSPAMRIRKPRADGKPYRWVMESFAGKVECRARDGVAILELYLGRRSERVFQNLTLPGRLADEHPSV